MDSHAKPVTPAPLAKPRRALTPQEQLEAARKVHTAAEHRVKLSLKLFEATEARTVHNQKLLEKFKAAQDELRRELQQDVAASLRDYDQWMGRIDESFTAKLRDLEQRLDSIENKWGQSQQRVEDMLHRTESMLQENRAMLEKVEQVVTTPSPTTDAAAPVDPKAKPAAESNPIYSQLLQRLQDRAGDEEAA